MRIQSIYKPFVNELPFFLMFFALMGAGEVGWKILYLLRGGTLDGQITLKILLESLSIWFLFAYGWACIFVKYPKKWLKVSVYALLFLMYCIQTFLRLEFGSPISPTYLLLLLETNPEEANDFITTYINSPSIPAILKKVAMGIIVTVLLEYLFPRFINRLKLRNLPVLSVVASAIVILILVTGLYSCRYYIQTLTAESVDEAPTYNLPRDPFSCSYSAVVSLLHTSSNTKACVDVTLSESKNGQTFLAQDDSLNIVLVIGESFNKYHSSLYGYHLETNPYLKKEMEEHRLFLFHDVTAPSNMTSAVLKNVLCCNSIGDSEPWYKSPYFPTLFATAGYDVYWWDNQKQDIAKGAVSFSVHALLYNDYIVESYSAMNESSFTYDEQLVDDFSVNWARQKKGLSKRNLFIFHLKGQHFDAKSRYPQDENNIYFYSDSIPDSLPFYTPDIKQKIAEYDNATRYNDYIISKINLLFSEQRTVLVYFSDHADEVYDYRNQLSRDQGPLTAQKLKYQYDIPLIVMCSDKYILSHPEETKLIQSASDKPFMTDNLCHMLFHLGGVSSSYYHKERDILSDSYVCPPRIIVEDHVNYDNLRWQDTN